MASVGSFYMLRSLSSGSGVPTPLPEGTVICPASIIAQYLIDQLVLSSPSNNPLLDWPVFVNALPETGSPMGIIPLPSEAVAIVDTAGLANKDMNGIVWEHEGVVPQIRSADSSIGRAKAEQIRDKLDLAAGALVGIGDQTWKINNCNRTIGIAFIGRDRETREDMFTINYLVSLRRMG